MGICGTAMGNIALLFKEMGYEVMGSDTAIYPPMSDLLKRKGISIFDGYDFERLKNLKPDCVVVGNAISRGNPEVESLLRTRMFPYVSLPELLKNEVLKTRKNIVITGTHGKTTTSTLTAFLLRHNNSEAGYFIGGVPRDLPEGAQLGNINQPFVLEGDEYDTAFFDKRSKFVHYLPSILVINNIEFDHADIFRDLQDVKRTFSHVIRLVPQNGFIVANGDDSNVRSLLPVSWTQTLFVGCGEDCDLQIKKFEETKENSSFSLYWKGKLWEKVSWRQTGIFNARNAAMAALSAGLALNPENPTSLQLNNLKKFLGVKRRQECLLENENWVIIEDFGHHPTAIAQTLTSLRNRHPNAHITACFEPRSNSACTSIFQEGFLDSLTLADQALIGALNRPEKLKESERLNTKEMASMLQSKGRQAHAFSSNEELLAHLQSFAQKPPATHGHLVCFFSNGSFDGIMQKFVAFVR